MIAMKASRDRTLWLHYIGLPGSVRWRTVSASLSALWEARGQAAMHHPFGRNSQVLLDGSNRVVLADASAHGKLLLVHMAA
eukprot:1145911-Pelagomonas_calceolata.AAC.3